VRQVKTFADQMIQTLTLYASASHT
jgi:hypothetical protein